MTPGQAIALFFATAWAPYWGWVCHRKVSRGEWDNRRAEFCIWFWFALGAPLTVPVFLLCWTWERERISERFFRWW